MRIEHVAIWTTDLERMKRFYEMYFFASAGDKYHNPRTRFFSYFLTFDSGIRLELMQRPEVTSTAKNADELASGYAHLAFAVASEARVRELTERLRVGGYSVVSEPRRTGDGYYESCVLDPDGNRVEITT